MGEEPARSGRMVRVTVIKINAITVPAESGDELAQRFAARAGASYVSPFLGRLDDISQDGLTLLADIVEIFDLHQLPAEVIAASIRNPVHVTYAAKLGAHIATVPYRVIMQMIQHPLTEAGVKKFLEDWETVKNK